MSGSRYEGPRIRQGDPVSVERDGFPAAFAGWVTTADGHSLTIGLDEEAARGNRPGAGAAVVLHVISTRGLVRAEAVVREPLDRDFLRVELVQAPVVIQRREFVRTGAELPALVEPLDGSRDPDETTTLDVGGGGVMLKLRSSDFAVGEPVRVAVELPGQEPVVAIGRVSRSEDEAVSVAFERIPWRERERLIGFVFSRLRSATRVS